MKPEDLVPDLSLCQRLRELGMPQDTIWKFVKWSGGNGLHLYFHLPATNEFMTQTSRKVVGHATQAEVNIAAPTVGELGEMLPKGEIRCFLFAVGEWVYETKGAAFTDAKEANARARLLIWCVEHGHVKFDEREAK